MPTNENNSNAAREAGRKTMSESKATQWVHDHNDDDQLDEQEMEAAFRAIFGREPDDKDREQGLWSHLCAAVEVA